MNPEKLNCFIQRAGMAGAAPRLHDIFAVNGGKTYLITKIGDRRRKQIPIEGIRVRKKRRTNKVKK